MKEIIIYLIVIAGGLLFDFIKKKMKKSADSLHVNEPSKSWSPDPAEGISSISGPLIPDYSFEAIPSVEAAHESMQKATSQSSHEPVAMYQNPELIMGIDPKRMGKLPHKAQQLEKPDNEEPPIASMNPVNKNEALAAHYSRWRQAIIDAQIIQRKF